VLGFVSFNHLYEKICELSCRTSNGSPLVLVGGCSRTGKSVLSTMISEKLLADRVEHGIVTLDAWLLDVEKRKAHSSVMERYDCHAIVNSVKELLQGKVIYPPVYNMISRRRISESSEKRIAVVSGIIIAEGVIALAINELVDMASLKIFVEVSDEVRIERLFSFYREVKKLSADEVETIIAERECEEVPFVKRTASCADIIVHNS
jgi:uridine kinase